MEITAVLSCSEQPDGLANTTKYSPASSSSGFCSIVVCYSDLFSRSPMYPLLESLACYSNLVPRLSLCTILLHNTMHSTISCVDHRPFQHYIYAKMQCSPVVRWVSYFSHAGFTFKSAIMWSGSSKLHYSSLLPLRTLEAYYSVHFAEVDLLS